VDLVGPLDIRGATVRVLLTHLLRGSRQSSWIVTRPGTELERPAAINRFWTMMYRASGTAHNGDDGTIAETGRSASRATKGIQLESGKIGVAAFQIEKFSEAIKQLPCGR